MSYWHCGFFVEFIYVLVLISYLIASFAQQISFFCFFCKLE